MSQKLGALLTKARQLKGVTLRQVERETKISNAYLSQMESGEIREPSPRKLHQLADYYGLSYATMMEAAGYAVPSEAARPSSSDFMFMGDALSEVEAAAVASFLQDFRKRSSGNKRK